MDNLNHKTALQGYMTIKQNLGKIENQFLEIAEKLEYDSCSRNSVILSINADNQLFIERLFLFGRGRWGTKRTIECDKISFQDFVSKFLKGLIQNYHIPRETFYSINDDEYPDYPELKSLPFAVIEGIIDRDRIRVKGKKKYCYREIANQIIGVSQGNEKIANKILTNEDLMEELVEEVLLVYDDCKDELKTLKKLANKLTELYSSSLESYFNF